MIARLPQGVVAIVITVFGMALTDAILKFASSGMVLWQIWLLRSAIVLPVLFVLVRGRIFPAGLGWLVARSFALVGMYLSLYLVLPFVDLALLGAAFYTAPFFIVGLSAWLLRSLITLWHWLAILTGFAGLLLIVRPFGAAFSPLVLMPVVSALFYAVAAIITRARCTEVPAMALAFWVNMACLISGLLIAALRLFVAAPQGAAFIAGPWHPMAGLDWLMIAALSALIFGITYGLARAYQAPRPEVIATFDYAYMIFAVFWGYVFFGEVPDLWTVAGMVLIAAGGFWVLMIRDPRAAAAAR